MAATDPYVGNPTISTYPARNAFLVTPNDSADIAHVSRGVLLEVAGDVTVDMAGDTGSNFAIQGLSAGVIHPIEVSRIYLTGTAATGITVFY